MPHRTRPMAALLLFTGLNAVLVSTITPVYDFVCFLPYWERRLSFDLLHPFFRYGSINVDTFSLVITRFQREHRREEREAALAEGSGST
ncbi:uncharacterized protein LOC111987897 [Olea europaea subsp. europaea]|uniref:Uncharacterized protein LOC111987897 n=1 Tax=Olea europaea subsp. europaea TaxID=158383 RepID=A0A8S0PV16_OLEEU|nr:uncharacterized protein LOC111987897 [Olea europaea subsp. europaea]